VLNFWPNRRRLVVPSDVTTTWRPKTAGKKLTIRLHPWTKVSARVRSEMEVRAEELAAFRGIGLAGVVDEG
jgi:hypothetical protein